MATMSSCSRGRLTYEAVARDLGEDYLPADQALAA